MSESKYMKNNRGVTPVVGVILIVAITILLASVIGVYTVGITDDVSERPTYSALELNFEEEPASQPDYKKFRWQIELTHTGGETVDADDIIVHLDHGDQRVTGNLNKSLTAGETVELVVVHNNQNNNTIPDDLYCGDVNVACRLAGNEGNFPDDDQIQLRMIHQPSNTILYEEMIGISGNYGIFNGDPSDIDITNETLTFA